MEGNGRWGEEREGGQEEGRPVRGVVGEGRAAVAA